MKVERKPAVFVTLELHVSDTLDPLAVGELIGEELVSMQAKGVEFSAINFVRGIAGTPESEDEE